MKTIHPKGVLIPIGGAEDKLDGKEVLDRIITETGKKHPQICLVTLASDSPDISEYKKAFKALKQTKISHLHYVKYNEANSDPNLEMIRAADAILLCGGDQLKLTSLLGGTELMALISERYSAEPNFVIAGTSAGAAAMSDTMIIAGSSRDAMIKGELELTNGMDLIDNVLIDTHFTERGRIGRLIQTVTCNPGVLGIGFGEDTAGVIHKGEVLEVIGSGLVIVVDGTSINFSDLIDRSNGEQISVDGIKMHVLGHGTKFSLTERKITSTPKPKN
jgi:cyanophycinase